MPMRELEISLGMMIVTKQPRILSISGIGSCVALAMRDTETRSSGLAHVVLPVSGGVDDSALQPCRYADSAVRTLLRRLLEAGATNEGIRAKLVGGAKVLEGGGFDGFKNVESARRELSENGILIVAEEVGSTFGRSVKFDTSTGILSVRRYQQLRGVAEFMGEVTI